MSSQVWKQLAVVYNKARWLGKISVGLWLCYSLPVMAAEKSMLLVKAKAQMVQLPIVVYFSRSDCQFCQRLSEELLAPMLKHKQFEGKAVFIEVSTDQDTVINFSGVAESAIVFAQRYGDVFTPSLYFLNAQGQQVIEPVIGLPNLDYSGLEFRELMAKSKLLQ